MSRISLTTNALGTGTLDIAAPNTNNDRTITLPDATDTLVGRNTTDTLTNKTLTSPTMTTPVLGTPSSGTLTSCTGLPLTTGITGVLPVANGGTGVTTASAEAARIMGYTSTVTSGGTTTLDNTSTQYQLFTGTSAHTVGLPDTSTLTTGWSFHIVNNSTGNLTVNSSPPSLVATVPAQMTLMATCISTSGTGPTDWEVGFTDFGTITGTGANVLAEGSTITNAAIGATTLSASSTVSGTGFSTYLASPPAIGGTLAASVTGAPLVSTTVVTDGYALLANGTLALGFATKGVVRVTPTATGSFTTTVPPAGTRCTLIVLTTGTTSFTMTFGTGFKSTGTLATGTVAARYFIFQFISDGTSVIEASRTVAIA